METLEEAIRIIGQKYFLMGFIAGFLYGAWVAWSLSGRPAKV